MEIAVKACRSAVSLWLGGKKAVRVKKDQERGEDQENQV